MDGTNLHGPRVQEILFLHLNCLGQTSERSYGFFMNRDVPIGDTMILRDKRSWPPLACGRA